MNCHTEALFIISYRDITRYWRAKKSIFLFLPFFLFMDFWYFTFNPLFFFSSSGYIIYIINLRYTYTRACTRNVRYFRHRFAKCPAVRLHDSHPSRIQAGAHVKCTFGGLNLLLGAVARGKVDSYDAYFVTRISPFLLLSLPLSRNHFVVGTFAFSCTRLAT